MTPFRSTSGPERSTQEAIRLSGCTACHFGSARVIVPSPRLGLAGPSSPHLVKGLRNWGPFYTFSRSICAQASPFVQPVIRLSE